MATTTTTAPAAIAPVATPESGKMKEMMIKFGIPVASAGVGALAGHLIGKKVAGGKYKMVATIGLAILGGVAGHLASKKMTTQA